MWRLYRSAPEHTRLSLEEEGHPEGPELPEDLTSIHQQIERMQRNMSTNTSQENAHENLDLELTPTDEVIQQPSATTPEETPIDEGSESSHQPDQEPSNSYPPSIEEQNEPLQDGNADQMEPIMLTSHDPTECLWCESDMHLAWRCEFELPLDQNIAQPPDQLESWLLLATTAKKQRTEVRLSELSTSERREFEEAKDAEIRNWISTGTLSKIFRN